MFVCVLFNNLLCGFLFPNENIIQVQGCNFYDFCHPYCIALGTRKLYFLLIDIGKNTEEDHFEG